MDAVFDDPVEVSSTMRDGEQIVFVPLDDDDVYVGWIVREEAVARGLKISMVKRCKHCGQYSEAD